MTVVSLNRNGAILPKRPTRGLRVVCQAEDKKAKVRFRVPYNTEFGQHLCISGGVDELGAWKEDSCIVMDWNDGNIWTTECELPSGADIEYKYILKKDNGSVKWQPGSNFKLELTSHAGGAIDISDSWIGRESQESWTAEPALGEPGEKKKNKISVEEMFPEETQELKHIVGTGFVDIGAPEDPSIVGELNANWASVSDKGFVEVNLSSKGKKRISSSGESPFGEMT